MGCSASTSDTPLFDSQPQAVSESAEPMTENVLKHKSFGEMGQHDTARYETTLMTGIDICREDEESEMTEVKGFSTGELRFTKEGQYSLAHVS